MMKFYSSKDCRKSCWQCSQFAPKIFKKYESIQNCILLLLSLSSKILNIRIKADLLFPHTYIYAVTVTKQSTLNQSRESLLKLVPFLRRDSSPTKRQTLVDARVTHATFNPTTLCILEVDLNFFKSLIFWNFFEKMSRIQQVWIKTSLSVKYIND